LGHGFGFKLQAQALGLKLVKLKLKSSQKPLSVEINLPSREEIENALKYLKKTELLKYGGPKLVDALEEVIQLV
jgi:hypothetical protein